MGGDAVWDRRWRAAVPALVLCLSGVIWARAGAPLARGQVASAPAGAYYVAPGGDDHAACASRAAPCATIAVALARAPSGSAIDLAAGTYRESLQLTRTVTVIGAGMGATVIDAGGHGHVVAVAPAATVTLAGVTLTGGDATALPSARDGAGGGGLLNRGGVTLRDSAISGNVGGPGAGGVENVAGATATLIASAVSGNTSAMSAGGIDNGGALTLIASTVSGNRGESGGGIASADALTVTASTISGNRAHDGGGVYLAAGIATLTNSTIAGNAAGPGSIGGSGGGLEAGESARVWLVSSTIAGNSAFDSGGLQIDGTAAVTAADTLVAGNTIAPLGASGPDCTGVLHSGGSTLLGVGTDCQVLAGGRGVGGDLIGAAARPFDPRLGPLQDNGGPTFTLALLPGSPAIDAGNPAGCADAAGRPLTTDQRGAVRPYPAGGRCDIGAYEYGAPLPAPTATPTITPSSPPPPPPSPPVPAATPTSPAPPVAARGAGSWHATGSLRVARARHTATLLGDGRILVVGGQGLTAADGASAELYDPRTGRWRRAAPLLQARAAHTATLLPTGLVLVAGGVAAPAGRTRTLASAELYDPRTNRWRATGRLIRARWGATATLLRDGYVLVAGGFDGPDTPAAALASAELYDPATGRWRATGAMRAARGFATATLLPDGTVLVAGGGSARAERYDPRTGRWRAAGRLSVDRWGATATLLRDGRVLVAGGFDQGSLASAELYDPRTNRWRATGRMSQARFDHAAAPLPDGRILVVGGATNGTPDGMVATAEAYDPATGRWRPAGRMREARTLATASVLPRGAILVTGGLGPGMTDLRTAELYRP